MNKPNGQYFVGPTEKEIRDFVNPLATRKICGIGRVMEKTLRGACGVETIKDLFDQACFSKVFAESFNWIFRQQASARFYC